MLNLGHKNKRFYEIAGSSLVEIDTHFEIAKNLNYCKQNQIDELGNQVNYIFAMLSNLITTTK